MTTKLYTDDELLRAADAVRQFKNTDGMGVLGKFVEQYRKDCVSVLYKNPDSVAHVKYAEASGAIKSADHFMELFERILTEAKKLEHD